MNKRICDNCREPATQSCPIGSRHGDSIIYPDFCDACYAAITEGNFAWFAERNITQFEPVGP